MAIDAFGNLLQAPKIGVRTRKPPIDYDPQAELDLYESIVNPAISGLQWLGETLDKPSRAVRGLLGGNVGSLANLIPFSDTFGITDPQDKASSPSGRDLLEQWGVAGENVDGLFNSPEDFAGDVGGFALELVTDPTNFLLPGAKGAATAGGKIGQKLGLFDNAFDVATAANRGGAKVGQRQALARTSVGEMIRDSMKKADAEHAANALRTAQAMPPPAGVPWDMTNPAYKAAYDQALQASRAAAGPDMMAKAQAAAKAMGVNLDDHIDEAMGGLLGISALPFGDAKWVIGGNKTTLGMLDRVPPWVVEKTAAALPHVPVEELEASLKGAVARIFGSAAHQRGMKPEQFWEQAVSDVVHWTQKNGTPPKPPGAGPMPGPTGPVTPGPGPAAPAGPAPVPPGAGPIAPPAGPAAPSPGPVTPLTPTPNVMPPAATAPAPPPVEVPPVVQKDMLGREVNPFLAEPPVAKAPADASPGFTPMPKKAGLAVSGDVQERLRSLLWSKEDIAKLQAIPGMRLKTVKLIADMNLSPEKASEFLEMPGAFKGHAGTIEPALEATPDRLAFIQNLSPATQQTLLSGEALRGTTIPSKAVPDAADEAARASSVSDMLRRAKERIAQENAAKASVPVAAPVPPAAKTGVIGVRRPLEAFKRKPVDAAAVEAARRLKSEALAAAPEVVETAKPVVNDAALEATGNLLKGIVPTELRGQLSAAGEDLVQLPTREALGDAAHDAAKKELREALREADRTIATDRASELAIRKMLDDAEAAELATIAAKKEADLIAKGFRPDLAKVEAAERAAGKPGQMMAVPKHPPVPNDVMAGLDRKYKPQIQSMALRLANKDADLAKEISQNVLLKFTKSPPMDAATLATIAANPDEAVDEAIIKASKQLGAWFKKTTASAAKDAKKNLYGGVRGVTDNVDIAVVEAAARKPGGTSFEDQFGPGALFQRRVPESQMIQDAEREVQVAMDQWKVSRDMLEKTTGRIRANDPATDYYAEAVSRLGREEEVNRYNTERLAVARERLEELRREAIPGRAIAFDEAKAAAKQRKFRAPYDEMAKRDEAERAMQYDRPLRFGGEYGGAAEPGSGKLWEAASGQTVVPDEVAEEAMELAEEYRKLINDDYLDASSRFVGPKDGEGHELGLSRNDVNRIYEPKRKAAFQAFADKHGIDPLDAINAGKFEKDTGEYILESTVHRHGKPGTPQYEDAIQKAMADLNNERGLADDLDPQWAAETMKYVEGATWRASQLADASQAAKVRDSIKTTLAVLDEQRRNAGYATRAEAEDLVRADIDEQLTEMWDPRHSERWFKGMKEMGESIDSAQAAIDSHVKGRFTATTRYENAITDVLKDHPEFTREELIALSKAEITPELLAKYGDSGELFDDLEGIRDVGEDVARIDLDIDEMDRHLSKLRDKYHEANMRKGLERPQEGVNPGDPIRGIYGPQNKKIGYTKSADATSIVHENTHALRPMLPPQLMGEAAAIVAQKIGPQAGWTKDAEEAFAEMLEAYMHHAKAPTPALQGTFDKMGEVFNRVYSNAPVPLTPEAKAFFDKLFTPDLDEWGAKVAGWLDKFGDALKYSAVGRHLGSMLSPARGSSTNKAVQEAHEFGYRPTKNAEIAKGRTAYGQLRYMHPFLDAGKPAEKAAFDRMFVEMVEGKPVTKPMSPDLVAKAQEMADVYSGYTGPQMREQLAKGIDTGEREGYFLRQYARHKGVKEKSFEGANIAKPFGVSAKRRKDYMQTTGGTVQINDLASDPALSSANRTLKQDDAQARLLKEAFDGDQLNQTMLNDQFVLQKDPTNKTLLDNFKASKEAYEDAQENSDQLAKYLHTLDPAYSVDKKDLFNLNPLDSISTSTDRASKNLAGAEATHRVFKKNAFKRSEIKPGDDVVDVNEFMSKTKLTPEAAKKYLANAMGVKGVKELDDYVLPRDIADAATKHISLFTTPEEMKGFMGWWDYANQLFTGSATSYFPAFHMRNLLDGLMRNWLTDAASAASLRDADALMRGGKIDLTDYLPHGLKTEEDVLIAAYANQVAFDTGTARSTEAAAADVPNRMPSRKPKSAGEMAGEWLGKFKPDPTLGVKDNLKEYNPFNPENRILQRGRDVGTGIEDRVRLAHFLEKMRRGYSPAAAGESARTTHFLYADLTPWERNVAKRWVPFWTFSARNLPFAINNLIQKPAKMASAIRLTGAGRDEDTPAWIGQGPAVALEGEFWDSFLGKPKEGHRRVLSETGLSVDEPMSRFSTDLGDTAFRHLGMLSPYLKVVGEQLHGGPFFRPDMQFKDMKKGKAGEMVSSLTGSDLAGQLTAQALSNAPGARFISTGQNLLGPDKGLIEKGLNFGTGAKITQFDPAAYKAQQARKFLRAAVEDLPESRVFESVSVTKEREQLLSPAEKQILSAYRQIEQAAAAKAKQAKAAKKSEVRQR